MKLLIYCLGVAVSFSALARTELAEKIKSFNDLSSRLDIYGQETKFEVLKNAYESARSIPSPGDFEIFRPEEANRSQKCVVAKEEDPENLLNTIVARYSVKVAGTPGNGPIFPGTSDRLESKVLNGTFGVFDDKYYHLFVNETTSTDFVVRVQQNNLGVFSDVGDDVKFYYRKERDYYPFKVVKILGANGPQFPGKEKVLMYGYCYLK